MSQRLCHGYFETTGRTIGVESISWTGVGRLLSRQGPSDSSLAVYCQGYRRKKIRPVGNGVIGSEGTFLKLDW